VVVVKAVVMSFVIVNALFVEQTGKLV